MTRIIQSAEAEPGQLYSLRCVAVNVCELSNRCTSVATEGHFCWVHARCIEAAAAKRREPVRVVPLQVSQGGRR